MTFSMDTDIQFWADQVAFQPPPSNQEHARRVQEQQRQAAEEEEYEWIEMRISPDRVLNVNNTPVNDFAKHVAIKSPAVEDGEWIQMDTSDGEYDIVDDLGSKLVIYGDSDSDCDMYSVSTISSPGSAETDRMDIDTLSSTSDSDSEFQSLTILVKINTLPHAALDWEIFNLARYSLQARIQAGRFENPALNVDDDDGSRMLRIETRETHENREIIYGSVELWLGFLMEAITDGFFVGIPFRMGMFSIEWVDGL